MQLHVTIVRRYGSNRLEPKLREVALDDFAAFALSVADGLFSPSRRLHPKLDAPPLQDRIESRSDSGIVVKNVVSDIFDGLPRAPNIAWVQRLSDDGCPKGHVSVEELEGSLGLLLIREFYNAKAIVIEGKAAHPHLQFDPS